MSLSIIAKGAQAPITAPIFGHLTHTDNMQFCVRPTGSANFFDLSNAERDLTKRPAYKGLITPLGITDNGGAGQGGHVVDSLKTTDSNEYTIIGIAKVSTTAVGATPPLNLWVLSDWGSYGVSSHGMGLLFRQDFANGVWTQRVRGFIAGRERDDSATSAVYRDAVLQQITGESTNQPAFDDKWHFIVQRITHTPGAASPWDQAVFVKDLGLFVNGNSVRDYSAAARLRTLEANDLQPSPMVLGGTYATNGTDTTEHRISIKEARFDSVALTDQQIEDQYQATKKWLKAEGAIDISHWA